jgi:hypothetical protein
MAQLDRVEVNPTFSAMPGQDLCNICRPGHDLGSCCTNATNALTATTTSNCHTSCGMQIIHTAGRLYSIRAPTSLRPPDLPCLVTQTPLFTSQMSPGQDMCSSYHGHDLKALAHAAPMPPKRPPPSPPPQVNCHTGRGMQAMHTTGRLYSIRAPTSLRPPGLPCLVTQTPLFTSQMPLGTHSEIVRGVHASPLMLQCSAGVLQLGQAS